MRKKEGKKKDENNSVKFLDDLCGCWYSLNLNPTLLIYKDHSKYLLSILHITPSGQASPKTYEIKNENDSFYSIRCNGVYEKLSYEKSSDELFLGGNGSYLRELFDNN